MFTGIVEELGEVVSLERLGDAARLTVCARTVVSDIGGGDSVAVNGCCLTVVSWTEGEFTVDVMQESLDKTALGLLRPGSHVNLERAVTVQSRLGGHLVAGHIDGVGTIKHREHSEHWDVVTISLPPALARYVVLKGSVAVDGVSLTVSSIGDADPASSAATAEATFGVSLIPTTLQCTTLGLKQPGDAVNLEVDLIAKYVERLLGVSTGTVVERLLGVSDGTVVERLLGVPDPDPKEPA